MKQIWKVILPDSRVDSDYPIYIDATVGAKAITVQVQDDLVCVWFEVDPDKSPDQLIIYCVGTGWGRVPEGKEYFATVQHHGFVWHFYR